MTAIAQHPHRVTTAVAAVRAELSDVAGASLWSMDATATGVTLAEVQKVKAQTAELEARLLAHAETVDLPGQSGATSTANWLAHHTRTTRREAHRLARVATGLDSHVVTRTALTAGTVNLEQAEAILRGLDTLPDDLDPDLVTKAEEHLVGLARDFDAKAIKNLSRRLLEVIAPDQADAHEAALLEKEEADALAATRLTYWHDSRGRLQGRFTLDPLTGAMLTKAVLAYAAPKHRAATGPLGDRKPTPERLGRAFAELIQRYPANKLPNAGGLNATVIVLIPYDTLIGGLKAAKLDTGETISPALARRLACAAGIIPAVLGGNSEVLDLGRSQRFHSRAQRIVATIEQGGCCAEGCDTPPAMTQMHHSTPWSEGGQTNTRDLWMLCPPDHRRAHDPHYTHQRLPHGKVRFTRRT